MAVLSYSVAAQGNQQLTANFKVKEFACKDGSDTVLIDEDLLKLLQAVRDHFGVAVNINSAYRSAAHNLKVGGSPTSQHIYGKAADISLATVEPLAVASFAETLGAGGIGLYPAGQGNFTHIDTRSSKSRWKKQNGQELAVSSFVAADSGDSGPSGARGDSDYAALIQAKAGLDDNTMLYLQMYRYGSALIEKLAKAMGS